MTIHEARLDELTAPHTPEKDPEAEDNVYLSYMSNDKPTPVLVMWAISLTAFAWYTWKWYWPDLVYWMSKAG